MYNNYSQQSNIDRINSINNEIANLEMKRTQAMMPQPITQNFQLNSSNVMRYANNFEEVQRDFVIGDTPFFSKDMSVVWIKNTKGEIKTYELNEIVQKDEKDLQIEMLQARLKEIEERISKNESNDKYIDESIENEESSNAKSVSKSSKK